MEISDKSTEGKFIKWVFDFLQSEINLYKSDRKKEFIELLKDVEEDGVLEKYIKSSLDEWAMGFVLLNSEVDTFVFDSIEQRIQISKSIINNLKRAFLPEEIKEKVS